MDNDKYKPIPVSFTLFKWQLDALRKEAHEKDKSVSAVVREHLFGDRAHAKSAEFKETTEYAEILRRLTELEARQIVSRIPATVFDYTASPVSGSPAEWATAPSISTHVAPSHLEAAIEKIAARPSIHAIADRQKALGALDTDRDDQ